MAKLSARFGLSRYEADEYYRIAIDFYRKNSLQEAIQNMDYALMLLPNNAEYWAARGFFYWEDGVFDKAESDFDQALKHNSFEIMGNYGKGAMAYRREEWQVALDYFMKAWAADGGRGDTLYYVALCHFRLKHYAEAKKWLTQAQEAYTRQNDKTHQKDLEKWLSEIEKWG
jgi:tetratricopeptide (TPR) repeat protein